MGDEPTVHGTCDERFAPVREAFAANFRVRPNNPTDVGASVAVTLEGGLVVDLWAGTADRDAGDAVAWERDTIINVWSTTKTVAALACLMLADAGELDVHAPVAKVWPAFAANGKQDVLVRHVMSHMAGLSGWQEPITYADLYDSDKAASLLAAQEPWWEPGTASGYHALTQGYLVGEIVRRITGQTIGRFVEEQITGPLGADFHIGTSDEHDDRVAHIIPPPARDVDVDPDSIAARTFANPVLDATRSWDIEWRRAEIPAAGGHGNARSVAMIHAPMACEGEANDIRLLKPSTVDLAFEEQCNGIDLVLSIPLRHGIGFGLPLPHVPISPNPRTLFWGGWGGSLAVIDVDARMSFGYVMNRMGPGTVGDMRAASILMATYACLART
ncbi:MAG: serine hydrolase domain-containing protein [Ilumatobacteraceae bacterium]